MNNEITGIFTQDTHIFSNTETIKFNFHFVRNLSSEIKDSVIQINIKNNELEETIFCNNLQVKVPITGVRLFNENEEFTRFIMAGECTSIFIFEGFAILE